MEKIDNDYLESIKILQQSKKEDEILEICKDIQKIEDILKTDNIDEMKTVHIHIDGKYNSYVSNWGHSTYAYSQQTGFTYEYLDKESLSHNLKVMMASLEGYKHKLAIERSKIQNIKNDKLMDGKINEKENGIKGKKVLISHSSLDKVYVESIVGLLESIGLHEDEIVCSSVPPYSIPLNNEMMYMIG